MTTPAGNGMLRISELATRSGVSAGTIKHYIREGLLELAVIDDGPGMREATPASERRGVGLSNTRERLVVLYGRDNCRCAVLNTHPGLRVEMALPLEIAPRRAEAPVSVPEVPRVTGAHA